MVWSTVTARKPSEKVEKPANKDFALFKIPSHLIWFDFLKPTPPHQRHALSLSSFHCLLLYTVIHSFDSLEEQLISFLFRYFHFLYIQIRVSFLFQIYLGFTSPAKKKWRISRILRKCNSARITGIYGTLISWELSRSILHVSKAQPHSLIISFSISIVNLIIIKLNSSSQIAAYRCGGMSSKTLSSDLIIL